MESFSPPASLTLHPTHGDDFWQDQHTAASLQKPAESALLKRVFPIHSPLRLRLFALDIEIDTVVCWRIAASLRGWYCVFPPGAAPALLSVQSPGGSALGCRTSDEPRVDCIGFQHAGPADAPFDARRWARWG